MPYALLKTLHILCAVLFLGAGLMTAYYKLRADRSDDLKVVTWYQREIVLADWLFTVPSGLLLPLTGYLMMREGYSWEAGWLRLAIVLFVLTGLLWLPAAWLQIRMRAMAHDALREGTELPTAFHRANRIWVALGVPAFLIAMFIVWLMVAKWGYRFWA